MHQVGGIVVYRERQCVRCSIRIPRERQCVRCRRIMHSAASQEGGTRLSGANQSMENKAGSTEGLEAQPSLQKSEGREKE